MKFRKGQWVYSISSNPNYTTPLPINKLYKINGICSGYDPYKITGIVQWLQIDELDDVFAASDFILVPGGKLTKAIKVLYGNSNDE